MRKLYERVAALGRLITSALRTQTSERTRF